MRDREAIPWEEVAYPKLDARIRYRHDVDNGWMDFEGFIDQGAPDDEPTFTGFIKWDGCANYTVGEHGMYHTCDVRDVFKLGSVLMKVYEHAARVMPNWIGDLGG